MCLPMICGYSRARGVAGTLGETIQRLVADTRGKIEPKPMSSSTSPARKAESASMDFNPDLDAVGPRLQTA